jgi:hypothetical protein
MLKSEDYVEHINTKTEAKRAYRQCAKNFRKHKYIIEQEEIMKRAYKKRMRLLLEKYPNISECKK